MLSLRKNSSGGAVGLDIDGRYLAAAQVESGRVIRGASADLPAGLVADGEVVNRDGLAEALKSFVAEAGLPKSVRLGVSNQQIVVRVVELPAHRGREAARRRRPLPGGRGDRDAAGRGGAGSPARRLHRGARRLPAHAGRARGRAPLDDRGGARGGQGGRPQAGGHRPRRVRARAHAGGRRRRPARGHRARVLPPRWRQQPCDRRRLVLLLHASALGRVGRRGRRRDAGGRDPPVDRLLHDPGAGQAGRRGRRVRPGLRPGRARREPGCASRAADHRRGAARRPRPLGAARRPGPAPPDGGRRASRLGAAA